MLSVHKPIVMESLARVYLDRQLIELPLAIIIGELHGCPYS